MRTPRSAAPRLDILILLLCAAGIAAHGQYCECGSYVYVDPGSGDYAAYTYSQWDGIDDPWAWYGWLDGSFNSASQSEEGQGFMGDELDWAGNVALGTNYEIDGDAGVLFLFICEYDCYVEESTSDSYAVPNAPSISLQYIDATSPQNVTAAYSVSPDVLAGCLVTFTAPDGQQGPPTYLNNCGGPSLSFDETTLSAGTSTFTLVGLMYGYEVSGAQFSVARADGYTSNGGSSTVTLGGEGIAPVLVYVLWSTNEFYSSFAYSPGADGPITYSTGGSGGASIANNAVGIAAFSGSNMLSTGDYGSLTLNQSLPAGSVSGNINWLVPLPGNNDSGTVCLSATVGDAEDGYAPSGACYNMGLP